MKRFRFFFAASALVLMSAVVLAKRSRIITEEIYASTSSTTATTINSYKLTDAVNLVGLATSGTGQARITNNSFATFYLWSFNGSTFTKLYAVGW
jgi:hypothetical protein